MTSEGQRATWSRRRFVQTGLVGGAALALLGGVLAARGSRLRKPPARGLSLLTPQEYAVLCALADRICPAGGEGAPGALALDVPATIDAFLASGPESLQRDVKAVLFVVENALVSALLLERTRPFTQLDAAEQDAALYAMRDSRLPLRRAMFNALKGMCASFYYGDQRTWARIGYPEPPPLAGLRAGFTADLVDWDGLRPRRARGED
jgi:hypothetical protein